MHDDDITAEVLRAAIEVHRVLGPGLLESAYQQCLAIELERLGLAFRQEQSVDLNYRGLVIARAFRVDLVVCDRVVVEVKAMSGVKPIHKAQVLTYLRLMDLRTGLLLNFGKRTLKEGIHRVVN